MFKVINNILDIGKSYGIKKMIEKYIANYGVVNKLLFDSKLKTLSATLQLRGEPSELEVTIGRYAVRRDAGKAFVHVEEIEVSREWMQALARDLLVGREFEVPAWVAMLI